MVLKSHVVACIKPLLPQPCRSNALHCAFFGGTFSRSRMGHHRVDVSNICSSRKLSSCHEAEATRGTLELRSKKYSCEKPLVASPQRQARACKKHLSRKLKATSYCKYTPQNGFFERDRRSPSMAVSTVAQRQRRVSWRLWFLFLTLRSLLMAHCSAEEENSGHVPHPHSLTNAPGYYDPYNGRRLSNDRLYLLPPPYYPPQPIVGEVPPPQFPGLYVNPYGYVGPPPDRDPPVVPRAPEPYITKQYDYTKDFLRSMKSIEEVRDPAVRAAFFALKDLEPIRDGSVFGDQNIKVCRRRCIQAAFLCLFQRQI